MAFRILLLGILGVAGAMTVLAMTEPRGQRSDGTSVKDRQTAPR